MNIPQLNLKENIGKTNIPVEDNEFSLPVIVIPWIFVLVLYVIKRAVVGRRTSSTNSAMGQGKILKSRLIDRKVITHDTIVLQFQLPNQTDVLGIQVGQHVSICETIPTIEKPEGEIVERKYTPISPVTQQGSFDLLIKIYQPNVVPRFPNGGKLTPWLEKLKINDQVNFKGPHGKLTYSGNGRFIYYCENLDKNIDKKFSSVVMVAGGSGITPIYQIIQAVAANPKDKTKLHVLFANKQELDILMRKELEEYQKKGTIVLHYTLDNPPVNWTGFSGFINLEMLQQAFPSGNNETLVCTCGPPIMNNIIMKQTLNMGYLPENQFRF